MMIEARLIALTSLPGRRVSALVSATLALLFGLTLIGPGFAGEDTSSHECKGRSRKADPPCPPETKPANTPPWVGVEVLQRHGDCPVDFVPDKAVSALSIDGGGVRGIIPAAVLAYVEARSGHAISDLFDVMSGVSTGSLIVVSLAHPGEDSRPSFTAAQIADDYMTDVGRLFPHGLTTEVKSTEGIFRPRYDGDLLVNLLRERLGEVQFSQLRGRVIVPTFDLLTNEAVLVDSGAARADDGRNFLAWEVLRTASAYPSIYSPGGCGVLIVNHGSIGRGCGTVLEQPGGFGRGRG